jgi:hypothetical protein
VEHSMANGSRREEPSSTATLLAIYRLCVLISPCRRISNRFAALVALSRCL